MAASISSKVSHSESSRSSKKVSSRSSRSHDYKENRNGNSEGKLRDYQTFAQKLNNNAAMCIEIGYYDKATQSLQRALEFYQKQSDENMVEVCDCDKCVGDGNLDFSADFRARAPRRLSISSHCSDDGDDDYIRKPKRSISKDDIKFLTKSISNPKLEKVLSEERRRLRGEGGNDKNANWSIEDEFCEGELEEDDQDLIYKRPIRVERVGHPMGGSLFLIITFNLALTHHLEVAIPRSKKQYDAKSAKKALLFYELTSAHESRLLSDSHNRWDSLNSIRFNKILESNLNQIFQYLPEASLPAAHGLVSAICESILEETERLSGGGSRRNSRSPSSNRMYRRRSNDDGGRISDMPRSLSRHDHGTSESRTSRSSQKHSGKLRKPVQRSSSSRSRLQTALGDMAPTSGRNSGS